ncbi:MAG: molecular chaperone DnaJ [Glaciihabitans sp.]|nr:molecular chaperone DnaJ [Glaciihabitans sp.]
MSGRKEPNDTRLNVARYQVERLMTDEEKAAEEAASNAGQPNMEQRAQYVEISIQQAMRRGDFDNLPGSGKPIANLGQAYDPDWWIRQKIEREQITGLGPPALTLRTEDATLDARLDAAPSEQAVRDTLEDFNKRIIAARRQLQGGPPVVTPTRDVEDELVRWRARRVERFRAREAENQREAAEFAAMSWSERRRAKRAR